MDLAVPNFFWASLLLGEDVFSGTLDEGCLLSGSSHSFLALTFFSSPQSESFIESLHPVLLGSPHPLPALLSAHPELLLLEPLLLVGSLDPVILSDLLFSKNTDSYVDDSVGVLFPLYLKHEHYKEEL